MDPFQGRWHDKSPGPPEFDFPPPGSLGATYGGDGMHMPSTDYGTIMPSTGFDVTDNNMMDGYGYVEYSGQPHGFVGYDGEYIDTSESFSFFPKNDPSNNTSHVDNTNLADNTQLANNMISTSNTYYDPNANINWQNFNSHEARDEAGTLNPGLPSSPLQNSSTFHQPPLQTNVLHSVELEHSVGNTASSAMFHHTHFDPILTNYPFNPNGTAGNSDIIQQQNSTADEMQAVNIYSPVHTEYSYSTDDSTETDPIQSDADADVESLDLNGRAHSQETVEAAEALQALSNQPVVHAPASVEPVVQPNAAATAQPVVQPAAMISGMQSHAILPNGALALTFPTTAAAQQAAQHSSHSGIRPEWPDLSRESTLLFPRKFPKNKSTDFEQENGQDWISPTTGKIVRSVGFLVRNLDYQAIREWPSLLLKCELLGWDIDDIIARLDPQTLPEQSKTVYQKVLLVSAGSEDDRKLRSDLHRRLRNDLCNSKLRIRVNNGLGMAASFRSKGQKATETAKRIMYGLRADQYFHNTRLPINHQTQTFRAPYRYLGGGQKTYKDWALEPARHIPPRANEILDLLNQPRPSLADYLNARPEYVTYNPAGTHPRWEVGNYILGPPDGCAPASAAVPATMAPLAFGNTTTAATTQANAPTAATTTTQSIPVTTATAPSIATAAAAIQTIAASMSAGTHGTTAASGVTSQLPSLAPRPLHMSATYVSPYPALTAGPVAATAANPANSGTPKRSRDEFESDADSATANPRPAKLTVGETPAFLQDAIVHSGGQIGSSQASTAPMAVGDHIDVELGGFVYRLHVVSKTPKSA